MWKDRRSRFGTRAETWVKSLGMIALMAAMFCVPATATAGPVGEATFELNDVSSGSVIGQASGANLGINGLKSIGDLDGDGRTDVIASMAGTSRGAAVLITPSNVAIPRSVADLDPSQGYRLKSPAGAPIFSDAGDQNGDGVSDFLVRNSTELSVIYGIPFASIADLPKCGGPAAVERTRCVDLPAFTTTPYLPPSGGYKIIGGLELASNGGANYSAGDFNGDGNDEIAVTLADGSAVVLPNGLTPTDGVLDLSTSLPAGSAKISGPAGALTAFGQNLNFVGDVNGDGFEDLAGLIAPLGDEGLDSAVSTAVIYGSANPANLNIGTMTTAQGFRVAASEGSLFDSMSPFGLDGLGGQGKSGLAISEQIVTFDSGGVFTGTIDQIAYLHPPGAGGALVTPTFPEVPANSGYLVKSVDSGITGTFLTPGSGSVGDLDGNGVDDLGQGDYLIPVGDVAGAGRLTVFFSKANLPTDDVQFDAGISGSNAVTIIGGTNQRVGASVAGLGDIDDDGIPDFAVTAAGPVVATTGSMHYVSGRSFMPGASTGNAVGVTDKAASLSGSVTSQGRDLEVKFEYGATTAYGDSTPVEQVEGSARSESLAAGISGLAAKTTYHYRTVATNDLGLTRYGQDKTFTTGSVIPPEDGCTVNPTSPGCAKYCEANPTAMGCADFPWCEANPGKCSTVGPAKLATLVASPRALKVKRGRKGVITAVVTNAGGKAASGVKLCVKAPKRFIKVKACQNIGKLGSGATRVLNIRVQVKKKAKKGKKLMLNLTASANGIASKRAKSRITVR